MGLLNNSLAYLCAPIDRAADNGVGWRKEITPKLQNLGVKVIDPTCKPDINLYSENKDWIQHKKELRQAGNYKELARLMKKVRNLDLRFIDLSSFCLVYLDMESHPVGTLEEVFTANRQKKPCLIIFKQGISSCPDWLFGVFEKNWKEFFFEDEAGLLKYLNRVNDGKKVSDRWVLFNY